MIYNVWLKLWVFVVACSLQLGEGCGTLLLSAGGSCLLPIRVWVDWFKI